MPAKLRNCPFCNSTAEWYDAAWTGIKYIRCSNSDCIVRPSTYNHGSVGIFDGMKYASLKNIFIHIWNGELEKIDMRLVGKKLKMALGNFPITLE